jgi:hypothetical protein
VNNPTSSVLPASTSSPVHETALPSVHPSPSVSSPLPSSSPPLLPSEASDSDDFDEYSSISSLNPMRIFEISQPDGKEYQEKTN